MSTEGHIRAIVEQIARVPGAYVDKSYLQGRQAVTSTLRTGPDGQPPSAELIDRTMAQVWEWFAGVDEWIFPENIPADYRYFLSYYGGLSVTTLSYLLEVFGVGPSATRDYGHLTGDLDSFYKHGWMSIGLLSRKEHPDETFVYFFLDLSKRRSYGSIIAILDWKRSDGTLLSSLLENPVLFKDYWRPSANSFTGWLECIAETEGGLGFG